VIRKNLPIALALGACFSLSACSDQTPEAPTPATTASGTAAPAATPGAATAAPGPSTLSPWTGDLSAAQPSQLCALDAMNGAVAVQGRFELPTAQPTTLEGWVATSDLHAPSGFSVVLDGSSDFQITGVTGNPRDDVAKAYGTDQLATAGFKLELPSLAVPAGEYKVLIAHEEGATWVSCDTNAVLSVK
jgi:hypothetical protein